MVIVNDGRIHVQNSMKFFYGFIKDEHVDFSWMFVVDV